MQHVSVTQGRLLEHMGTAGPGSKARAARGPPLAGSAISTKDAAQRAAAGDAEYTPRAPWPPASQLWASISHPQALWSPGGPHTL